MVLTMGLQCGILKETLHWRRNKRMSNLKDLNKNVSSPPAPGVPDFLNKALIIGIAAFLTYLSKELNSKLENKC